MELEYSEKQLNKTLETFYVLTNASICVFDCDFRIICSFGEMPCFCSEIRKNKSLFQKCLLSDKKHAEEAKNTKKSVTYTCHAGLAETISPIYLEGVLLGYVIFGGLRDSENKYSDEETVKNLCDTYGFDYNKLIAHYDDLSSFTHKQLNAYIEILNLCIKDVLTEKILTPNHKFLSNSIITFIQEHFTEKITVKSLCRKFGLSEKPLYYIVKRLTGTTVNAYINDLRIEKAKSLLQNDHYSIAEISSKSGFDDYNYFIRVFKKRTLVSPLKYRKLFIITRNKATPL